MVTDYKPKMAVLPRWLLAAVVVLVSIVAATATWIPENSDFPYADDVSGDYCRTRVPTCCTDRDDECTVPILDTVCYCDMFCSRDRTDCCPDFYETCQGHTGAVCYDNGKKHFEGTTVKRGCNTCTCKRGRGDEGEWQCGESICLMREDTARDVNAGRYGWRADTYSGSHFSPLTLDEGSSYMLGTKKPDKFISTMVPINYEDLAKQLPTNFDARDKWGEWVGPIRNQELCNASWAFSTTAAASDRLAILSNGTELERLSAQQLLSCNRKNKNPCLDPGALENSWWFMRRTGTVPETCYPFVSGNRENVDKCRFRKSDGSCPSSDNFANNRLYKMTPAYLLSNNTVDIQYEIFSNGPVQAALLVKEDFYVYKSGVYKHTGVTSHLPADYRRTGYHSVRLLGWGEDYDRQTRRSIPYWLAANSWGEEWGERGLFKIIRGQNECEIESFIVGVLAKAERGDEWFGRISRVTRELKQRVRRLKKKFYKRWRF